MISMSGSERKHVDPNRPQIRCNCAAVRARRKPVQAELSSDAQPRRSGHCETGHPTTAMPESPFPYAAPCQ
jgi:hypothetical protein